tara:strand:+ start:337 stop:1206 length:870 start_codon:yes stop_codon:yes gene_type:complete
MPFLGKQPTAGFASIVKDDLTGNGTTGPYTLSKQVANANDIAVFVGNVRQEPTDAYTVNGNQLTMTGTVSSSINFYVLHIAGTTESSVVPADNTISTAKLQNDSVTGAKIENNPTIAGTLTSTGLITASAGVAIGGTGSANTLDDYEEGTWTPFYTTANDNLTLNGNASTTASMYTTQNGSYIKIGKEVICHMTISTTGVTSHGGSGNLWVGGLPFTTAATVVGEPRGVNGAMAGRFNSFTPDQLVCNGNATTVQIRAGFESYPTKANLNTSGSGNQNVIEALIVYSTA